MTWPVSLDEGGCPGTLASPESSYDGGHCVHWWDCEPCCWCGYDGGGEGCDCPKHNPGLYDEEGNLL